MGHPHQICKIEGAEEAKLKLNGGTVFLNSHQWRLARLGMETERKKGYAWAISAGVNAAFAAISAKYFSSLLKYALIVICNVIMWGCYVNSMKSLSSLQATVTNFATNFLVSGSSGFFLFGEALPFKWFSGAVLIVIGVIVLSKSSIEKKTHTT